MGVFWRQLSSLKAVENLFAPETYAKQAASAGILTKADCYCNRRYPEMT